jgi:hypothetical protein
VFSKFVSNSVNFSSAFRLLAEYEIFLAGYFQNQEVVMKFSKDNGSDYEEILSTQEEADIRIILQSMFVNP